ncbi:MAG: threonine--tRNA ligase [Candidatus Aminicenantes bacterium]|nr:threonine--tRNA ligase [Candidatus Aminicenantes bacterium]
MRATQEQIITSGVVKEAIRITHPDGSQEELPKKITLKEAIERWDESLLSQAVAGKVNGELVDLSHPLQQDSTVEIISIGSPVALEICRHSASHVLAQAVTELFPEVKVGIGPSIEEGFYYDFQRDVPFTPEDLEKIEARMREIIEKDEPFLRMECSKEKALKLFSERNEWMKVEIIEEKVDKLAVCYKNGSFVDFCRGPHLPSTGKIKAFKLLSVAGAYWKGDEGNPMLQRIYGNAFFTPEELDTYLQQMEEAKRRDHRKLGRQLELFSIEEKGGPGLVYWHPKGALICHLIEEFLIAEHLKRGYQLVKTPHIAPADLWKASGHFRFYRHYMYPLSVEDEEYVLKPMNCVGHILIYKSRLRSYRELPVKYTEMGTVYRYEKSGVLHGMLRVRGFTQDDAHIFCTPEQLPGEIVELLDFTKFLLSTFGFEEYKVELSVRDPKDKGSYAGGDEEWEKAERALVEALERRSLSYKRQEGEAVFYGPKIDIKLIDSLGRGWQVTTIQFDFNLPGLLEVNYIGKDSKEHSVFLVHRAILGSLERFVGILIEHYNGCFPLWLAPSQVVIIPVSDRYKEYARKVSSQLEVHQLRTDINLRNEKVGYKVREAELQKTPYMLIVGEKEQQKGTIAVRSRKEGDLGSFSLESFIDRIKKEIDRKALTP